MGVLVVVYNSSLIPFNPFFLFLILKRLYNQLMATIIKQLSAAQLFFLNFNFAP